MAVDQAMYIYLSNEEPTGTPVEVYFDDFKVTHTKSPVVQGQDYYPFGLAFNEYRRENSVMNSLQYNAKESQEELGLGWLDYGWRMYMADLGRWNGIDMLADKYYQFSPYNYVSNNPISLTDPNGTWIKGKDGNKISWTVKEDGSIKWSSNTSRRTRKDGERLWKSNEGKNALYAMQSSPSQIKLKINENSAETTIKGRGEIEGPSGEKYDKVIKVSIGLKGSSTAENQLAKGAIVSANYLLTNNVDKTISSKVLDRLYDRIPSRKLDDPFMPYPEQPDPPTKDDHAWDVDFVPNGKTEQWARWKMHMENKNEQLQREKYRNPTRQD